MEKQTVIALIKPDTEDGTTLWANQKVISMFLEDSYGIDVPPPGRLEVKVRQFCNYNFRLYLPNTIKLEYGKTHGVHVSQYRIVGFFDNGYSNFIALDWFVKKTQRNDRRMNAIYKKVDDIREAKAWIKA
ncbi:MAG: hypothetical protein LIQ31_03690 [Planctomycetes bacterium]|nr:hypothetical protein [Planctomycetota bacterium]